ncbi:MAG: heavy-metal-associated domain-containing protein [Candidatus Levyibacteriota bacterium]
MKKVMLKITGMECVSCAFNIDGPLEDADGVKESKTNYAKQVTEVIYDESKITKQQLAIIVKEAGYIAILVE